MENNRAYRSTSLKIAGGFLAVALMAFATTRSSQPETEATPPPVPVDKTFNVIQYYDTSALMPLAKAWKGQQRISIVHTGDSHIQPDYFTGKTRQNLQALKGNAGMGLVFPFSAAKTYSSFYYTSRHTGEWHFSKSFILPAKIPLGVGGMAIRTSDAAAGFVIQFKEPVDHASSRITLFYNHLQTSFSCIVRINDQVYPVEGKAHDADYPQIVVTGPVRSIEVSLQNGKGPLVPFEFYGMSVENADEGGLVYHAAGVGGAQYKAILHQKLFAAQLAVLNPQLVIIDYGTNDYLYDDKIPAALEKEMQQVIGTVKKAAPNAAVLLTTAQDLYWKKRNCRSAVPFVKLVHRLARQNHCLVYDWFHVSGGQASLLQWQKQGYAQNDLIHLTKKGYELKGDLFSEALVNACAAPPADSVLVPFEEKTAEPVAHHTEPGMSHLIQKGETLSAIAKKYGVTVEQIKTWNGLQSDRITAGESLTIKK